MDIMATTKKPLQRLDPQNEWQSKKEAVIHTGQQEKTKAR